MRTFAFQKWEATGNDFLFVDSLSQEIVAGELSTEQVVKACDRVHGFGADGVVLYQLAGAGQAHMTVINSDGSPGDMCGNALRCLAEILRHQTGHDTHKVKLSSRFVEVQSDGKLHPSVVMGEAATQSGYALLAPEPTLSSLVGNTGYLISFGNPHFVVPSEHIPENWQSLGKDVQAEADRLFGTGGINCGFLKTVADSKGAFELRVYERGAGATQSCGSGACAASAVLETILRIPTPHRLNLSGGQLTIARRGSDFVLRGPANKEYDSDWKLTS